MKKLFKKSKLNQKGSTLILVIVAMAFLGILGALMLTLTVTNLKMKIYTRESEDNFYDTEGPIGEIQAGIEEISTRAMQEAYEDVMNNYVTINSTAKLKDAFDKRYLMRLAYYLTGCDAISDDGIHFRLTDAELQTKDPNYLDRLKHYKASVLKDYLSTDFKPAYFRNRTYDAPSDSYKDTSGNKLNVMEFPWLEAGLADTNVVEHYLLLKNVEVTYQNDKGYETTIKTDIRLDCPTIYFASSGVYPEYTKYILIGDDTIMFDGATSTLSGNVYGGPGTSFGNATTFPYKEPGGIRFMNTANVTMNSQYIISRGDLSVYNNAGVEINAWNGAKPNIWVENINTVSTGYATSASPAKLKINNGNCYVSDDLSLDATDSDVKISGNYDGFSYAFQNVFNASVKPDNANFSSSLMINGKRSSLDMSGITSLRLAGLSFISRNQEQTQAGDAAFGSYYAGVSLEADDILTGESASVKSNQIAYLVPNEYVLFDHNPVFKSELDNITNPDGTYSTQPVDLSGFKVGTLTVAQTQALLDPVSPYKPYYYVNGDVSVVYYYLNFASVAAANEYYDAYAQSNKSRLENHAEQFIMNTGGFQASANVAGIAFSLGNISQYIHSGGNLNGSLINPPAANMTAALSTEIQSAMEYKSRQLALIKALPDEVTNTKYRFTNIGGTGKEREDKSEKRMFERLIDNDNIVDEATASNSADYGFDDSTGTSVKYVPIKDTTASLDSYIAIVHNQDTRLTNSYYRVSEYVGATGKTTGLIVANGNVLVDVSDFEGLIIAGGVINVNNAATGQLKASPMLIQKMLKYAVAQEKMAVDGDPAADMKWATGGKYKCTQYFKEFQASESIGSVDLIDISNFTSFENYIKNEDE